MRRITLDTSIPDLKRPVGDCTRDELLATAEHQRAIERMQADALSRAARTGSSAPAEAYETAWRTHCRAHVYAALANGLAPDTPARSHWTAEDMARIWQEGCTSAGAATWQAHAATVREREAKRAREERTVARGEFRSEREARGEREGRGERERRDGRPGRSPSGAAGPTARPRTGRTSTAAVPASGRPVPAMREREAGRARDERTRDERPAGRGEARAPREGRGERAGRGDYEGRPGRTPAGAPPTGARSRPGRTSAGAAPAAGRPAPAVREREPGRSRDERPRDERSRDERSAGRGESRPPREGRGERAGRGEYEGRSGRAPSGAPAPEARPGRAPAGTGASAGRERRPAPGRPGTDRSGPGPRGGRRPPGRG